uniref:EGF-like domain-containing protein n=1 Tax=Romanomermis culicivorax TaxID=13658 RepID=A0A915IVD0_ROMCU
MFLSEKFIFLLFIILTIDDVSGHIRLTYPKPRQSLDFLIASKENEPCGLSQRSSYETLVKAGSSFKITWISTVPSKVYNVSFYILDGNGATKNYLSAKHEEICTNIHSESSYEFPLSLEVCRTCILRIEQTYKTRNSIEKLWSCADVSIRSENVNPCLNQGRYVKNQCLCTGYFTGEFCQTENLCLNDEDCGGPAQGKCVESDLKPFIYGKICVCRLGYMGLSCEKKSAVDEYEERKYEQFVKVADN